MLDLSLDNKIFINTELDAALQELDILFNTEYTELIGYPYFGSSFEQFSWHLNPEISQIESYIYDKISQTLYLSKMTVSVNVTTDIGVSRLIYNVRINVMDPNGNKGSRRYQFR
jgi:hypothetical protein